MFPGLALALLLGAAPAPGATVYVVASKIRLRAAPTATAAVVVELPIATACVLRETSGDWVKLDCGGKSGFTMGTLVADKAPVLDEQVALAKNPAQTPADRLVAAQRALALQASPATRALMQKAFLDVEHETLAATKDLEPVAINCTPQQPTADCVRRELSLRGAKVLLDMRGKSFVSVVAPAGGEELFITRGVEKTRGTRNRVISAVHLEVSRARWPRDAAFEEAVLMGATVGDRDPAIVTPLPRAQRDQVLKVPAEWWRLSGDKGKRTIKPACDADLASLHFFVGLLGDMSLDHNYGQEGELLPLKRFKVTPRSIEFHVATDETAGVIEWPTTEKGVAFYNGEAWAPAGSLPVPHIECGDPD